MKTIISGILFLTFFSFCSSAQVKPEFRGVWIATVDNIDWPLRGDYVPASQKAEFIRQLDMHKKNGMNAVIVQVRPSADAFYPSSYEPWSQWLTGTQGKAPSPYYDPLKFMIEETHKRGMVFHAWLNPYRAVFNIKSSSLAKNHITRRHPGWFLTYGDKKYFDPANREAQQFVVDVVKDIVKRYNIDAIHMDDYFYPYRIAGKEFPDEDSYRNSGTRLSKDDWRRSNVDSIIHKLSVAIKAINPRCQFGISPFSVWRNKEQDPRGSPSLASQTNYDDLYADILLWLEKDWIDYVAPQLYFEIGHSKVDFKKMLDWWADHAYGRHLYIGIGLYRAGSSAAWKNPDELPDQIRLMRQNEKVQGAIYFSSKTFNNNPNGWSDSLRNNYYREAVPVPEMDWLSPTAVVSKPVYPVLKSWTMNNPGVYHLQVQVSPLEKKKINAVRAYVAYGDKSDLISFDKASLVEEKKGCTSCAFDIRVTSDKKLGRIYLTAVDENGSESHPYPNRPMPLDLEKQDNEVWVIK